MVPLHAIFHSTRVGDARTATASLPSFTPCGRSVGRRANLLDGRKERRLPVAVAVNLAPLDAVNGLILNFAERQSVPYEVSRIPIQYRPDCAADFSVTLTASRTPRLQVLWKPPHPPCQSHCAERLARARGVEFTSMGPHLWRVLDHLSAGTAGRAWIGPSSLTE